MTLVQSKLVIVGLYHFYLETDEKCGKHFQGWINFVQVVVQSF